MGISRRVVQGILNHKDRSVTAVYDRYELDPESPLLEFSGLLKRYLVFFQLMDTGGNVSTAV